MSITKSELDRFHEFASRRIETSDEALELEDLIEEWNSKQHRSEINAAIREGLADIAARRVRPAEVVTDDLESRLGLSR